MAPAVTDVTIDRLHARYNGFDRSAAARLDRALVHLLDEMLDAALAAHRLPALFAVCIPWLDVSVDLEPSTGVESAARQWADQMAGQLATTVTTSITAQARRTGRGVGAVVPPGPADGVVIYRREIDAVVDIVASVAVGDRRRLWAWNQTGVWPRSSWPTADDVALLLCRRPTMAAPVLAAIGAPAGASLSGAGWRMVAAAVASALEAGPTIEAARIRSGAAPGGLPNAWTRSVIERIPPSVWRESTWEQQATLAVLALAAFDAALTRSVEAIVAVVGCAPSAGVGDPAGSDRDVADPIVDRAPDRNLMGDDGQANGRTRGPEERRRATGGGSGDDESVTFRSGGADRPDAASPEQEEPGTGPSRADRDDLDGPAGDRRPVVALRTDFGGVALLIRALNELGVVDAVIDALDSDAGARAGKEFPSERSVATLLARILNAVTGVALDDPIVGAVCGPVSGLDDEPIEQSVETGPGRLVDDQVRRLISWLDDHLDVTAPELDLVWRRPARIDRQPGWIEIEFALVSVDTRIRAAGLDLDPGFVWWLGSVVRFRYV